jgi:hypothetical protein
MILLNQNKKRYKIDYSKPVQVYRNLHKGCWSVKQNGLVKAHSDDITMFDCEFLVNQNNRLKVIREKRKNVHAFVKGILSKYCHKHDHRRWGKVKSISYNPYKRDSFYDMDTNESIYEADNVRLVGKNVFAN